MSAGDISLATVDPTSQGISTDPNAVSGSNNSDTLVSVLQTLANSGVAIYTASQNKTPVTNSQGQIIGYQSALTSNQKVIIYVALGIGALVVLAIFASR